MSTTTCECGAVVQGDSWHMRKHQNTQRHRDAMAAMARPITASVAGIEQLEPDGQQPTGTTVRRMVDILRGRPAESVADGAATLAFDGVESPPAWPRNPVPVGEPVRRGRPPGSGSRSRPPGAEDIAPLFATGLMLLTAFVVGKWASPTKEEADAIAAPLSNILARRIDIAAKLGRDANDSIALSVALMAYLYRVGPIAAERVRTYAESRRRGGPRQPAGPPDDTAAYGMASGSTNGSGPNSGPTFDPLAAVARARTTGLGSLDRDFGYAPDTGPAVGDR